MEPLQVCENCKQKFPESKIHSHFSYCRRNIKKCSKCNQMIDINYQQEHDQQFHTKKSCKYCKNDFQSTQLIKHQNVCNMKPKFCQFCQLNIQTQQFKKHQNICGSRTKVCNKCTKNIILRQYQFHIIDCPGKIKQSAPIANYNNLSSEKKSTQLNKNNQNMTEVIKKQQEYKYNLPTSQFNKTNYNTDSKIQERLSNPKESYNNINKDSFKKQQNIINTKQQNFFTKYDDISKKQQTNANTKTNDMIKKSSQTNNTNNIPKSKNQQILKQKSTKQKNQVLINQQKKFDSQKYKNFKPSETDQYQQYDYFGSNNKKIRQQPRSPSINDSYNQFQYYDHMLPVENVQDLELQKALYEQYQKKVFKQFKMPEEFKDLGITDLSQSFYRDLNAQKSIQQTIKSNKPKNNQNKRK